MLTSIYNRTAYSLLQSTLKLKDLLKYGVDNKVAALGICEYENLYSAMSFYRGCKDNNIKPIISMELSVKFEDLSFNYILFPRNNQGYKELSEIATYISDKHNLFTKEKLDAISENIFVVDSYSNSYISYLLANERYDEVKEVLSSLKENQYISIGPLTSANNRYFYSQVFKLFQFDSNKLIALAKTSYNKPTDIEGLKALTAIKLQTDINDSKINVANNEHLRSGEELSSCFDNNLIASTEEFVDLIDVKLDEFKTYLPDYKTEYIGKEKEYLTTLAFAGLKKRLNGKTNSVYTNRLKYELDIICKMNFQLYFLVIYDIIIHCHKENIAVGSGRGSAVGCLTAYCLGITHLDPIKYNLFFERFLNPERISMPDIDIDIADNRRAEVIEYLKQRYGNDHVANIMTLSTLANKSVIRDLAKVYKIQSSSLDIILNIIDRYDSKVSLESIYSTDKSFNQAINSSKALQRLYETALIIESLPKNTSTHASGVVLSKDKLTDVIPLTSVNNIIATQYGMEHLESMGLIKIDLLGLSNLNIISESLATIEDKIDILKLPLNDERTYKMLSLGMTNGIFQLESQGMRSLIKRLQPNCFEDIATVLALYRPGALDSRDLYLNNRANPSSISYLHEDLKPILSSTYGIILYQEQIMQISVKIAGYSLAKADILRKAISKKNANNLAAMRQDFVSSALKNGYNESISNAIYDLIEKFGGYGFNKSHAIGYSMTVYQQAYLKANYPVNFYCAALNSIKGNKDKTSDYVSECRFRKIKMLKPDLNKSTDKFTIEDNSIRFPLTSISKSNTNSIKQIIRYREENGPFKDIFFFMYYYKSIKGDDATLENLIAAGAFDCFGYTHNAIRNNLKTINSYIDLCTDANGRYIEDAVSGINIINYSDTRKQLFEDQLKSFGFYIDNHPVESFRKEYPNAIKSNKFNRTNGKFLVLAKVSSVKEITTKNSDKMCFVNCEDELSSFELTLLPESYKAYKDLLVSGNILLANVTRNETRNSILVNNCKVLNEKEGSYE